jgi:hypothetical protein
MQRRLRLTAAIVAFLGAAALSMPASAAVIFSDNFDTENAGVGELNYDDFANWTVSDGTVDLIGNGFFDFFPTSGLYVDLDGSTPNDAGVFTLDFVLGPGSYVLTFDLAGSQRGDTNTVEVRFDGALLAGGSITYASAVPQTTTSIAFTVLAPGLISFENVAGPGDNIGLILDNVSIATVPEPGSLLLIGCALSALGLARRRRA